MSKVNRWLLRAKEVHGDKYEYPTHRWGDDIKAMTKVPVICREHGEWLVTMNNHVNQSNGCRKCQGTHRKSVSERVEQMKAVHGNRYDYSLITGDILSNTKIPIQCSEHGVFYQTVSAHVSGQGCCECNRGKNRTITDWIDDFKSVHGNKYIYPVELWSGDIVSTTAISVICKKHGVFKTTPTHHFHHSRGCAKCSGNAVKSRSEWIDDFKLVHGDKYDYGFVGDNVRSDCKVVVMCKEHGSFKQRPDNHVTGNGCPKCAGSNQDELYINSVGGIALKYGISKSADKRLLKQDRLSPLLVSNLFTFKFSDVETCKATECKLKATYTHVLSKQDMPDGYTETTWVSNLDDMIRIIEEAGGERI